MRIKEMLRLLAVLMLALVWSACPKGVDPEDPEPPSLCPPAAFCPNGQNPALLQTWDPVGGTFRGISIPHDCIDGVCPDAIFTFSADSTYRIEYTEVGQDSGKVFPLQYTETGQWRAFECMCREIQLPYGPGTQQYGKLLLTPDKEAPYTIAYDGFSTGLYLNSSSRDSTFNFFLKKQ